MGRMTPVEIAAAKAKLDELIDGTEIQTAGWIPGKDWSGTPFQPIYEKAARWPLCIVGTQIHGRHRRQG